MTFSPPPTEVQRPEGEEEVPEHAQAPDDDSRWKMGVLGDGTTTPEGQLQLCEARLKRAMQTERPRTLISAILGGGCTALKGEDCARCRICPAGMSNVTGYYRANKQNITICAEKLPSEREIERTLTHELIHAYDHCRKSMRVPFVGRQAPWALTCPTVACSETAALSRREDVYRSAFHSTSNYGMCAQEVATKGSARETLDRIFNVCLADYAPFTADGSKRADASEFPPFHPEVERGQ